MILDFLLATSQHIT